MLACLSWMLADIGYLQILDNLDRLFFKVEKDQQIGVVLIFQTWIRVFHNIPKKGSDSPYTPPKFNIAPEE